MLIYVFWIMRKNHFHAHSHAESKHIQNNVLTKWMHFCFEPIESQQLMYNSLPDEFSAFFTHTHTFYVFLELNMLNWLCILKLHSHVQSKCSRLHWIGLTWHSKLETWKWKNIYISNITENKYEYITNTFFFSK